jgi:crotonobetainyl-CoA:carnitine CoA-transferase CaiB-like acyl-CoA transferase
VPTVAARDAGRDTDDVLRRVLGYDDAKIAALRAAKALG